MTKNKPQHAARLNRLVFGVALLWLVTSVLLLVLAVGSAQSGHKYEHKIDHTRKNTQQQLYASAHQAAARASFTY